MLQVLGYSLDILPGIISHRVSAIRRRDLHYTLRREDTEVESYETKEKEVTEGYVFRPTPGPRKRRIPQHRSL